MVFFATPDMPPQAVTQEQVAVVTATSTSAAKVQQKTFGVCELFYATEDDRGEIHDTSVNSLHPAAYMDSFLPSKMQDLLNSRGSGGIDWDWYVQWAESFTVTILTKPAHGKFVNLRNDPKLHDLQYLPNKDYVGKDRVDVLVEGKDDQGRLIALTLKYFINVLPEKELFKISDKGTGAILQTFKKLCGVGKGVWTISEAPPSLSYPSGQTANPLGALLANACQNLSFADLTGGALGETTGTGTTAQITLDDNAAGHGWYIDYTPYLNGRKTGRKTSLAPFFSRPCGQ
jgi:hypothetical protein